MKRLIVNADDLGMSAGINRGILEAHHEGIVSSSTVMVNMAAAREGIRQAQRDAPALGLGLHFNLSYGRPLSDPAEIPSLVRSNGNFVPVPRGLGLPHLLRAEDIRAELTEQFERFCDYAGCLPDHLDSHQLVGSLSAECREVMLDLAERYQLSVRQGGRTLFSQLERDFASRGSVQKTLAPALFRRYPLQRHSHIFEREVRTTDYFEYRFHAETATVEQLLRILETLPDGVTELVCHPGYLGGEEDGYGQRERELAALTDSRVKAKVAAKGVVLTTFASLASAPQLVASGTD